MEKQDYRKIEFTEEETFVFKDKEIMAHKLKGYANVYLSNNCHIKPKGLHIILKNVNGAIKDFEIDDTTYKIIIFSYKDSLNIFGAYFPMLNEVYLNKVICDADVLMLEKLNIGHIERHEIWHLKQALTYKSKFGLIDKDNYEDYINYARTKAKSYLDSLGVNEDNVCDISDYASYMYAYDNYDEVEAEIKAKKGALCIFRNSQMKSKN